MYSPKIAENLIPTLYRLGLAQGKPMTQLVDEAIRAYLQQQQLTADTTQVVAA